MSAQTTTRELDFAQVAPDETMLFRVNPGVPIERALAHASCLLAAVGDLCSDIGGMHKDNLGSGFQDKAWACAYLVEMAKAVIDASTS